MQVNKNFLDTITFLESHKHYSDEHTTPSLFEAPAPHTEYWLLSDIAPLISKTAADFSNPKGSSIYGQIYYSFDLNLLKKNHFFGTSNFTDFFNQHVVQFKPKYHESSNTTDYKLSRYAILSIFQKYAPNNFTTLTYFMSPANTPANELHTKAINFLRIPLRNQLKQQEHRLSGAIAQYQADQQNVRHTLHNTFFGTTSIAQIKEVYKLSTNKPIADYMGYQSLDAASKTISNTLRRTTTYNEFLYTLQQQAHTQRLNMISQTGIAPENDIHPQPISTTKQEFNKMYLNALKRYANEKLR